jgi:hypothetical protein
MRGIPRKAVNMKLHIERTCFTADQIADKENVCPWNIDNYGGDMTKPGAQEYYDSLLRLYASWGVDYIRADDMIAPTYHEPEVAALATAIARCGREIVLSLSPGAVDISHVEHLRRCANLWRISNDLWDLWEEPNSWYVGLNAQFEQCAKWAPLVEPGHWPDGDMLPLGVIGKNDALDGERSTRLTHDEQTTLMTLWCIFRSPLMFGGDLAKLDSFTESLLTNREVLAVNQNSAGNRPIYCEKKRAAWVADVPGTDDKYLALFNRSGVPAAVSVDLGPVGFSGPTNVRSLWERKEVGVSEGRFGPQWPAHGAGLYRLSRREPRR